MTPRAEALTEILRRIEAGGTRRSVPAELITIAGLRASWVWRAMEGSLDAVVRLEGGDPKAEAKARLMAVLARKLAEAGE